MDFAFVVDSQSGDILGCPFPEVIIAPLIVQSFLHRKATIPCEVIGVLAGETMTPALMVNVLKCGT